MESQTALKMGRGRGGTPSRAPMFVYCTPTNDIDAVALAGVGGLAVDRDRAGVVAVVLGVAGADDGVAVPGLLRSQDVVSIKVVGFCGTAGSCCTLNGD